MLKAIGLMSGTSLDGIDVALLRTDGESIGSFGPTGYRPYSEAERALLRKALEAAPKLTRRDDRSGIFAEAEHLVTRTHAEAVEAFLAQHGLRREEIDVIGFHGQTILHRPQQRLTIQIGDGQSLAKTLSRRVVFDFRADDVAEGGQGAPFVPVYHRALVTVSSVELPVVVVNIGGVSNMTYIDQDTLIACDTGPGNALLDDFMLHETGKAVDQDGRCAARGKPDGDWITRALEHPFFAELPPKSLDRNDFAGFTVGGMPREDGAATLTAFTAASIAHVMEWLPRVPQNWIVVGGGANNPTLMAMLRKQLAPANVRTGHELGWSGDAIEAQAFAYLAVRSLKRLPLTYPGTTGVRTPITGGVLVEA
jgi:anhydro-N-acetylmuramic acid kinase